MKCNVSKASGQTSHALKIYMIGGHCFWLRMDLMDVGFFAEEIFLSNNASTTLTNTLDLTCRPTESNALSLLFQKIWFLSCIAS